MSPFAFIILLMAVIFSGVGGIKWIERQKQGDGEPLPAGGDPDTIRRLAEAVEALQGQVENLTERIDFTERLLQAPKEDGSDRLTQPDPYDRP